MYIRLTKQFIRRRVVGNEVRRTAGTLVANRSQRRGMIIPVVASGP